MSQTIELCNGAFIATLVKGENGKQRWQYTPTLKKTEARKHIGHEKERPQFKLIPIAEQTEVKRYNETLNTTVIEITKFLKQINNVRKS